MIILKLGGSIITDKSKEYCFQKQITDRLSQEIKRSDKKVIIVHGAGSFGHILAKKYNLNLGHRNNEQLRGFSLTHTMVQKLNTMVLDSLHENGINAVSISPHSVLKLDNHKPLKFNIDIFKDSIEKGFTPVTFGDVVLDKKLGFSICSGDLLVELFAEYFKPEKVVFILDEDGIYTTNPKIDKNAKLIKSTTLEELNKYTTLSDDYADVTGGMAGKIDTIKNISKLGFNTILLNGNKSDRLYKVLVGKDTICTFVHGGKK